MGSIKKISVLIVEDEFRIGQLIQNVIDWDKWHMEFYGYAENGQVALEMMTGSLPDVIITDIKMPVMNGLDLIKQVSSKSEEVKFIVISGFKEFEYAHTALKFGVTDYLLKPIKKEELNAVLEQIFLEKKIIVSKQEKDAESQKMVEQGKSILHREILNEIDKSGIEALNLHYNLKLEDTMYRTIVVKLDYRNVELKDLIQEKLVLENIVRIIDQSFKKTTHEQIIAIKDHLMVFGVFNYNANYETEIKKLLQGLLTEIKNYVYAFGQYEITMGIGNKVNFAQIGESLSIARKGALSRIVEGSGKTIYYEEQAFRPYMSGLEIVNLNKIKIENIIESQSRPLLEHFINELYGELRKVEKMDCYVYLDTAFCLIEAFLSYECLVNRNTEKKALINQIFDCYSLLMLTNLLKNELGTLLEAVEQEKEQQLYRPIREAMKYIEEHFSEKIVLEDVAMAIGLNPVYFSNLFKKKTGKNFMNYLVEIRMGEAKNLLRTSNLSIEAIAEQVVYQDKRYFSQTFDKIVGIKPSTYRKLYS